MAVVMPFVSYWVFNLVRGRARDGRRVQAAAFLAGYIGLFAASMATAVQFGIQPIIASDESGTPLYAPYPLEIAVPVMAAEHLLIFGVVEGIVTTLILRYFMKNEMDIIHAFRGDKA
jgi:cobalt/nickel transport system permease protein